MDDMSIAALSVGMSQARVQQELGIAALKMELDASAENILTELPAASEVGADPALGTQLDIYA